MESFRYRPSSPRIEETARVEFRDHPQYARFVAALQDGGFQPGEELPYHQPNCYGCGPDNADGFGLAAVAGGPGEVSADHSFDRRHEGGPGVVHGGAIAAVFDELLGRVLVRDIVVAVTVELSVSYLRAVHLDDPCRLQARLLSRDGRDLTMAATLEQHGIDKAAARATFREIELERAVNRYERPGRSAPPAR